MDSNDDDLEGILEGPASFYQVEYLKNYIDNNLVELEQTPEYLEELRAFIYIILRQLNGNQVIKFPVQ